ncbi:NAD(P)H-dependent oxidoreductase [Bradyrhizobium sp. JYMT SZCCT0428]|uniref:NADPH-dependent FMN reductase n=1 Tax=Bradyrhizobium sp. JYMT SZCCT0428 TaxID=2807673 RepID=UPI00289B7C0A|nr:NAD(P)H-dependent oxidoreductase [Bradyrhizobium sp. JYMT SZCCT0428]
MNIHVDNPRRPLIVGVGGTQREQSSSELAVRFALRRAALHDMRVQMFGGEALILPLYDPSDVTRTERAKALIQALREADGIILSAPAYHGGISGLIKNAIDYTEDMKGDDRAYFDGRSVGTIACAGGWQAAGTTLGSLRSVVHSLRGWNAPMGVMINTARKIFAGEQCLDSDIERNISIMVEQVVSFARNSALLRAL